MAEYIDREKLLRDINHYHLSDGKFQHWVEVQQAADVAPVRHGRWISKNPHGYEWTFVCSNCGYVDGYPFNDRHNYCPNCGANMESEE